MPESPEQLINSHVNLLWEYVRENKDSLDSPTVCAKIRAMVDAATDELVERVKSLETDQRHIIAELTAISLKAASLGVNMRKGLKP